MRPQTILENLNVKNTKDDDLKQLVFYISQFDIEIKYLPGVENLEADCLSHNAIVKEDEQIDKLKIVNYISLNDIKKDQLNNFSSIKVNENLVKEDSGIKYYCINKDKNKIIISEEFSKKLIKNIHLEKGHIGPQQLMLTLFPFYYCNNFKKMIYDIYRGCETCLKNKSRTPC